jgi:phosphoserine phosphatase
MKTQSRSDHCVTTTAVAQPSTGLSCSSVRIAAFFDLDGTLLPLPSLERRLFNNLRAQRAISFTNYFWWLAESIRLAPRGISAITHGNKAYLRGFFAGGRICPASSTGVVACLPLNRTSAVSATAIGSKFPAFFPEALDHIAWHIAHEHTIVLVTGTLAPLANQAALALILALLARGTTTSIEVCATHPEQQNQRWTGRIIGEPIFGEAKTCAIQKIAAESNFDLARSYAYGDGTYDRWMLGTVGRPHAVNPSRELERIARLRNWPILYWKENLRQQIRATENKEFGTSRNGNLIAAINPESLV